ncbi:MAG: sensor histidine kinase [bacterium]|nr:sensor histidine kinase [bacterium]
MHRNDSPHQLQYFLRERTKELTALHKTARLMQDDSRPIVELLTEVVNLLPPAWQYPEVTVARIAVNGFDVTTRDFDRSAWMMTAPIQFVGGAAGLIEVGYVEERSPAVEGPFLAEERELLDSLADMLRNYLQYRMAIEEIKKSNDNLERLVSERTLELSNTNVALQLQIQEHENARREIVAYQKQLRKLAAELSLSEARDRRAIASDLHDHIGQALAFIRMKVSGFSGESVFCGFEESTSEILTLLDQTIQYTRSLTFQISPPVLYELGLGPSLDWLAEQFTKKHRLQVKTIVQNDVPRLPEEIEVFAFRSVQEILTNAVKHAQAKRVEMKLSLGNGTLELSVSDDGVGFPPDKSNSDSTDGGFGLFSIRERLMHLGGSIRIDSSPKQGARVTLSIPVTSGKVNK